MNLLTNRLTGLYSNLTTPHCVVGLGGSNHLAHNRAQSGFFVRTIQNYRVMTGLNGEAFGSVGSKCLPANPVQSCHLLLGGFGDGLKNLHLESAIMQYHKINPCVNLQGLEPYQSFIYGVLVAILSPEKPICFVNNDLYASLNHSILPCVVALKKLEKLGFIDVQFDKKTTTILMRQRRSEVA